MAKCFVIQPFDNGKFDKRFDDIYAPAIEECGLEVYRVDKDPKSKILIDDIVIQIKDSDICLAETTEDNPNVWFELGTAIAYDKDVVIICSDEREGKYPFDIQHRALIKYFTASPSDFTNLKNDIKDKINAFMQVQNSKKEKSNSPAAIINAGLEGYEIKILTAIASKISSPNDSIAFYSLKNELEKRGVTEMGTTLGIKKLLSLDFIKFSMKHDNNDEYFVYQITDKGLNWLIANKALFTLDSDVPPINTKDCINDIDF